jgi:concentrative nucleoside transporter, CNT family
MFLQSNVLFAQANAVANNIMNEPTLFENLSRGILGMATIVLIAWLASVNRKAINWRTVGIGLAIQLVFAIGVLYIPFVQSFFEIVGKMFIKVLDFTRSGSAFLLGDLVDLNKTGYIFAFQILPTIVFFSGITSLLFYLGVIQKVVYILALGMTKLMKISGMEALSVAGNIFLGQTEAPLMIKAYLDKMNKSEIFLVMTGGMATIAGGVLAAYVGFLGGDDPVARLFFAKHLLTASVMAAPGAIVLAKIIFPQTEEVHSTVEISKDRVGSNILDAISNGTTEGLKLALNVGGMLLVFIAFIAMGNYILGGIIGRYTHLNELISSSTNGAFTQLSFEFILGYLFSPFMWLLGVPSADLISVGQLLGQKLVINEFIGYSNLAAMKTAGEFASQKAILMATYMLCGFANFSSVGIQIGGIGSLMPKNKVWLSEFGMRALLAGALASCLSATIVGMIG